MLGPKQNEMRKRFIQALSEIKSTVNAGADPLLVENLRRWTGRIKVFVYRYPD